MRALRTSFLVCTGIAALMISASRGSNEKSSVSVGNEGGASHAAEKRIIILTNGNSPFWDAGRAGMQDAERNLKLSEAGLRAVMEVNDGTDGGQIDKLRQFASQDDIVAVGISVNTAGNEAIVEEMRKLQKKGVQVVTLDSDVERSLHRDGRFAFIGTDNLAGGRELGKCAAGLMPDGAEYVTFVGITGAQNAKERIGGFAEGAGAKFVSKDTMGDENDRTRARENVRNAIGNHPNLKVLVGIWSYNAPAIVDVVQEKKVRDRFKIIAFDAEPAAIDAMSQGMIDAMVVQNPYEMGYQGVRLMKSLVQNDKATIKEILPRHGRRNGDIYDTGIKVVVPDKGSPLKPAMFGKKTQFLKLSDFREWLKKYNLTGS